MRLDSPKVKRAAGWISAFALPLFIVQIAGWMSGSAGPSQAQATEEAAQAGPSLAEEALRKAASEKNARERPSSEERALAERIEALRREPFGPTPMLHAPPATERGSQSIEVVEPYGGTFVAGEPIPAFHLQAVMSSSATDAARALINGKHCTIGETVPGSDWTVVEINAEARRVILKHAPTNRTVALTLKSPN